MPKQFNIKGLGLFQIVNEKANQEQPQQPSQPAPQQQPVANQPLNRVEEPRNALGGFQQLAQTDEIQPQRAGQPELRGGVKVFNQKAKPQIIEKKVNFEDSQLYKDSFIELPNQPSRRSLQPSFSDVLKEMPSAFADQAKEVGNVIKKNAEVFKFMPKVIQDFFRKIF